MSQDVKEFIAIVWKKESKEPGMHETFVAKNREEARLYLERKYGKDILVSLTDIKAANQPR